MNENEKLRKDLYNFMDFFMNTNTNIYYIYKQLERERERDLA